MRALFALTAVAGFAAPSYATSILLDQCNTVGLCSQVQVDSTLNGNAINVTVSDVAGLPHFGIFGDSGGNHAFAFNVNGSGVVISNVSAGFSYAGAGLNTSGPYGDFEFEIDGPHSGSDATLPLSFTITRTGGFSNADQWLELNSDGYYFEGHVRNNDTGLTGWAAGNPDPSLFSVNPPVVPEPGTMVLLGSGLLGIAAAVRRRTAK